MKDNATVKTGKTKIIGLVILVVVLVCGILCGALWLWKNHNHKDNIAISNSNEVREAVASDEKTLRKLLLEESEISIRVDKDMEIDKQFIVKGKKTLTGNAKIHMALWAELGQSILVLSEDASLTMNGLTLDGNFVADGIHMDSSGSNTLTYFAGTIRRTDSYGIHAYGSVTVKDVNIENADLIAIFADRGSEITMSGGSIKESGTNDIYIQKGADVKIGGNPLLSDCRGDIVINYGNLDITGGTFADSYRYVVDNYGVLNVSSDEKNGTTPEFTGSTLSVFCTRKDSKATISGAYVHDTSRQGVVMVGGDVKVSSIEFVRTGYHAIEVQSGNVEIEKVTVTDSKGSAVECRTNSHAVIKDLVVNGCANIGVAVRAANVTGSNIKITGAGKYGIACGGSDKEQGKAVISDVVVNNTGKVAFYTYNKGNMELHNAVASGAKTRGIQVDKDSSCTLSGKSKIQKAEYRAVEVRGKFVLNGGEICNNQTKGSGAGIYVADKGNFTMNGGSVHDNITEVRGGGLCVTEGTVTIKGGQIYNNKAKNDGGGIYAIKKAAVYLKDGSIRNNKSERNGNGIFITDASVTVMMGEKFYLGGNDVKLGTTDAILTITGSSLAKHSAKDPLRLTPSYSAKEGTIAASCKSAAVARALSTVVSSGDGSYLMVPRKQNFEVAYATADMDMTGADTVFVSNFEELKAAVASTASKRYIVLRQDIAMKERLRFPGGVTICIQDDGNKRTLTRENGFADNLLVLHYGTGLYLSGTKPGNLVLDGTHRGNVDEKKVQSLVKTAGSVVIQNAVLENNGSLAQGTQVRGALLNQIYGDFRIDHSVLRGGSCSSGGAIMLDKGKGLIEESTITGNQSVIGGGAIRVAAGTNLEVKNSEFTDNHAGSMGGAIVAVGKSKVTVTDTRFSDNTAVSYGGAIGAQDEGTVLVLNGTDKEKAVFENNSSEGSGAVFVNTKAQLSASGYRFVNNRATDGRAGAISFNTGVSAQLQDMDFYGNEANTGGAVYVDKKAQSVSIVDTVMRSNKAKLGGAIYSSGTFYAAGSIFEENQTTAEGGAVYGSADSNTKLKQCAFTKNTGKTGGGAIFVAAKGKAESEQSVFTANVSTGNGGAIHCKGTFLDIAGSYIVNSGKNGGALIAIKDSKAEDAATIVLTGNEKSALFRGNQASATGSAIYVNNDGSSVNIAGYNFEGEAVQNIQANGTLIFENLPGAVLVPGAKGKLFVTGETGAEKTTILPTEYKAGKQILAKTQETPDDVFKTACKSIKVAPDSVGNPWALDENGKLLSMAAYAARIGDTYYDSWADAIAYANEKGGTGEQADIVIYACHSSELGQTITIKKNITIQNEPGKEIVIKRSKDIKMFQIDSGAKLTLGTNEKEEKGRLIVDAGTADTVRERVVDNKGVFILGKNGIIQNANGSQWGSVLINRNEAELYGSIKNNTCTGPGGVVLQYKGKMTIHEGTYSGNKATRVADSAKKILAGYGGALYVQEGTVHITGGKFADNSAVGQGGALWVQEKTEVTISNVTFKSNSAGQGGAIYCLGTIKAENSTFEENEVKGQGAAIYINRAEKAENGGNVSCKECIFLKNTAGGNGGAVNCTVGKFQDTDSTYTENTGAKGGALIVMQKGVAELKGTGKKAKFSSNKATAADGSAIYVLGTATVQGYAFDGEPQQTIFNVGTCYYKDLSGVKFTGSKKPSELTK